MVKQELIDRSPVRFLEKATNGGLKPGSMGVITSKKGLGKTSVLVQIGLDKLLQDKQVVHVSFNQSSDFVMSWYEDIFAEMAKKKNISIANDVKLDLIRKRVILNFNQDVISSAQIVKTLKALAEGGIVTDCLIIDGLDFTKVSQQTLQDLKTYAAESGMVIWFSCNSEACTLNDVLSPAVASNIDAVVHLEQKPDSIQMNVLKGASNSDSNLKLDSKTLLIAEK